MAHMPGRQPDVPSGIRPPATARGLVAGPWRPGPRSRFRLVMVAASGLLVLALIFATSVFNVIRVRRSADELSRAQLATEALRAIDHTVRDLEARQRDFLRTHDSMFAVDYRASLRVLGRQVDSLHQAQTPGSGATTFSAVDSLLAIRITQLNGTLVASGPGEAAVGGDSVDDKRPTGTGGSLHAMLANVAGQQQADWLRAHDASVRAGHYLLASELAGDLVVIALLWFAFHRMVADRAARDVAETSLCRSNGFLDAIIDLVPSMVYIKDAADLRFVRFNRAAERLTGLPRAQVIGHDDFELYPRPLAEHAVTLDRAVLASDAVRDVPEEALLAPNGAVRTLHTRKVAIHDGHGRPAYLLAVSEDITAQKRAEREIARARADAAAANRAQSAFLARMTEELRTPVNSIMGFSQLLEEESVGPLTEPQQRYVAAVLTSGRQLLDLINDMLDLSMIAAGEMELSRAPVTLQTLVQESLAQMEPLATAAELQLAATFDAGRATALADPVRLRQILHLLLRNAIACTPPGGTVTVRVGASPNRSSSGAVMMRLSVVDTGVGIRPEDLERVFIAFEQVDAGADRARYGAGVGLALARHLATLHDGSLWVESEFGLGSSFHLELPTHAPHEMVSPPASVPADAPLLVVVDADDAHAVVVERLLQEAGVRLERVADASAAMERVSTRHTDAITLDAAALARDGVDVLRRLKADPRTARVPVLVTSVVGPRIRALALGAFDWLRKPVQRDALVASVQQAVANASTQHPLVVVVDADPAALDVMRTVLEGAGCRVMTTTDGTHAMHLAATQRPDAIVVDLTMPEMSGLEVVMQLRQAAATRDAPIIICDGRDLSATELQRVEARLRHALATPDAAELVDALRHVGVAVR